MKFKILSCLFIVVICVYSCKDFSLTSKENDLAYGKISIADSRMNDYALYDVEGGFHRFSTYNDSKAIVLFVQGNGCPIVRNSVTDFHNVVDGYKPEGFTFFMINSSIQDKQNAIKKESKDFGFKVPILHDKTQIVADALDIKITAEVIILDPVSREIVYRGPINNRLDYETQKNESTETYLRNALDAIIDGKYPEDKQEMTKGCKVSRLNNIEKDTITYTSDIAPLLINKCIRCHRDGGVAPWSMTDYDKIVGWSAMIEQVLLSKRMPPWKADPKIGSFSNSFHLDARDRRKLIRWVNNGMPYGKGKDPLYNFDYSQYFKLDNSRVPDTTIVFKKQIIPANGRLEYKYQNLDLSLLKGKWLKGLTEESSNNKTIHHLSVLYKSKNKLAIDRPVMTSIDNVLFTRAGGAPNTIIFPENAGVYLDEDTQLTLETHFVTTGRQEENVTKIHLYFHDKQPQNKYLSLGVSNTKIKIDPFKKHVALSAKDTLTQNLYVHSVFPHMHYRGKEMKVYATKPDGKKINLISVPDYDFNWQNLYQFDEPLFLPKETIITVNGAFDNSFQNRLNPDPSKEVIFGPQSTDEMFFALLNYTVAKHK